MNPRPLPGPEIYNGIEELGLETDLQGWHSQHAIFAKLIEEVKPKVIVEVGSWKAASAIHMASISHRLITGADPFFHIPVNIDWSPKIYCCDTWLGGIDHEVSQDNPTSVLKRDKHGYPQLYHQFLHNVAKAGMQNRIVPVVQTSINAGRLLLAHKIKAQLTYIDGSHEYPDALFDMDVFWGLLDKGGIMFGDDYGFPGVAQSVLEFANHTRQISEIVDRNFWMFRKP